MRVDGSSDNQTPQENGSAEGREKTGLRIGVDNLGREGKKEEGQADATGPGEDEEVPGEKEGRVRTSTLHPLPREIHASKVKNFGGEKSQERENKGS